MKRGVIIFEFDKILCLKNSTMRISSDEPVEMMFCKHANKNKEAMQVDKDACGVQKSI